MLAIASFIMHYPDEKAAPGKMGVQIEFHDLGDGVLAIFMSRNPDPHWLW
jgi:hypothetical protein